ncbi:hypothetical protein DPEC_G00374840 [Dallia pectoralis]|nr:hypothetical protein DPEC_G00374840 [Dallia pectoralis]
MSSVHKPALTASTSTRPALVLFTVGQEEVLTMVHQEHGHQDIERTLELLRQRCYWPGMSADVSKWCQAFDFLLGRVQDPVGGNIHEWIQEHQTRLQLALKGLQRGRGLLPSVVRITMIAGLRLGPAGVRLPRLVHSLLTRLSQEDELSGGWICSILRHEAPLVTPTATSLNPPCCSPNSSPGTHWAGPVGAFTRAPEGPIPSHPLCLGCFQRQLVRWPYVGQRHGQPLASIPMSIICPDRGGSGKCR